MEKHKEDEEFNRYKKLASICVNYNLRKTTRGVTQFFDTALREVGLRSTQFSLLVAVFAEKESTMERLSGSMLMDRTTLSRNLAVLEKQGLVKISAGKDRRSKTVLLTLKGELMLQKAVPQWKKAQAVIVRGIGYDNWKELKQILGRIDAVLSES